MSRQQNVRAVTALAAFKCCRINAQLDKTENSPDQLANAIAVETRAMLDQNVRELASDTNNLRLKQAQAMLDLFEADCGRAAVTLDEIKEWASTQEDHELRFRVERLLSHDRL
jgi:hypothetical protein